MHMHMSHVHQVAAWLLWAAAGLQLGCKGLQGLQLESPTSSCATLVASMAAMSSGSAHMPLPATVGTTSCNYCKLQP